MDIRALKNEASDVLRDAAYLPRRLVLIHTGIALGLSFVLALISYLLDTGISANGGLSGLGTQAALDTAQVVLQLASIAVMPFWQAGLLFVMLGYVRNRPMEPRNLTEGFRRFTPILTSSLMMGLQYVTRGIVSMYLSSMLITMTPFAAPVYELSAMLAKDPSLDISTVTVDGIGGFYAALVVIFLLVFAALVLPVFYRYRMVSYIIMDDQKVGGMKAMFLSRAMMHHRRRKLFKLDLSFWWFYGLELLLSVISLGSVLLPLAGINLPFSEEAAYWIFQLLCMAGQLGLYYWARPKLEVTYALCYEEFRQNPEPPTPPKRPQVHPWEY
jgi:uncharacterized membrane protein